MKYTKIFFMTLALAITSTALAQTYTKSMRIDPGYLYDDYPNTALTPAEVAVDVVAKVKANGVNTIFLYAYNSVYGAFYPTNYSYTLVEGGYGVANIFALIAKEAKANSIKVIGVVPLNDFKKVWTRYSSWRVKKKDGTDYKPDSNVYLLSAWHDGFRNWYKGFLNDFLTRNPNVDGVEAVEAMVDYFWDKASDYNSQSNQKFAAKYPSSKLGDATWLKFRADGLTSLHGIFSETIHAKGKLAFAVQTWAPLQNGQLMSSSDIRDGCGFDFDGILNLSGAQKFDGITAEFMWQQWAADYGDQVFNVNWASSAVDEFTKFVAGRAQSIAHIEISEFSGALGNVQPTAEQFGQQMQQLKTKANGLDIYDYHQINTADDWSVVQSGW